jgi:hypothetical protein
LPYILVARDRFLPRAHVNTIRSWLNHYKLYGDVPAVRRPDRLKRRRNGRNIWTELDTQVLKEIIDDKPYLYRDEIQEELYLLNGGKRLARNTMWRKLVKRLGYSLQVVVSWALQQDDEERDAYIKKIKDIVYDPAMAVYVDETAKDRNAARRRRHWRPRGTTPVRESIFVGDDRKQYRQCLYSSQR